MSKTFSINSIYTYIVIFFLLVAVAVRGGALFWQKASEEPEKVLTYTIDDIQAVFPEAFSFEQKPGQAIEVKNEQKDVLGYLLCSNDFDVRNIGYAGEIPLFIALNNKQQVIAVHLLKNQETEEYIDYLAEKKLLEQWNGFTVDSSLVSMKVDAVSGATYSSDAIIGTVKQTASAYLEIQSEANAYRWLSIIRLVLTLIIVVISLGLFFRKNAKKKFYWYFLLLVFIVFGIWFKQMLSVGLLHTWLTHGVSVRANIELIVIMLLSIAMSVSGNRKYYCNYLCAMGAAQILASKISPFKIRNLNLKISIVTLRSIYLTFIWTALLLGFALPLFNMEPFMAFSFRVVSPIMVIAGIVIVVLSLFFNRPWCQLCPTGCLLDSVPSIKSKK